ncbi:unnamed protein product [Arctia plantaginis]|uniref:Alpha-mannosidase n=1 Tax=Arctia plantaginis TaxID=874455 RepID=A0A8S1B313_ARCPL|nr:unnamed protein product [Arctia plantaginis]
MIWYILIIKLICTTVITALDAVSKNLLTPIVEYGEACGYESCPQTKPDYLNVHIVASTHGELGGSRTFLEHFTGDGSQMFTTSDINMKNILDSVITSLWTDRARTKLNATFLECARPLVTWQADTFGHSREFASLMAQMGFDGHFISPISFDDELARMTSRSLEFVWRGSDDLGAETDIFTHKLFDGYWSPPGFCFGIGCTDPMIVVDAEFNNVAERIQAFKKQILEHQSPFYTTNNVMVVMGQKMGYHDAKIWFTNIDTLIRSINEAKRKDDEVNLNLMYSTPACYLKEIKKALPVLKTKQDDFLPIANDKNAYFTGMFYSRPAIKYLARELHLYLLIAKQLQMFGHLKNHDQLFEDIQWIAGSLLDHTVHTGGMQEHVNSYYTMKAHKGKELCMQIIRQAFNQLRGAPNKTPYYMCPFNVSSCWTISHNRSYIIIYNPLAWPVTLPVRLPVQRVKYNLYDNKGDTIDHSIIKIPEFAKRIPERFLPSHSPALYDEMVFIAEKIPPMGYRSYYLQIEGSRTKRAIIKKMTKNKKRKFLTRQSHSVKASDDNLITQYDDDYYLDDLTHKPTIIEFANVSKGEEDSLKEYGYVLTPRSKSNETYKATEAPKREGGIEAHHLDNISTDSITPHQLNLSSSCTGAPTPDHTELPTINSTDKLADTTTTTSASITPLLTSTIKTVTDYYGDEGSFNITNDEENNGEVTWEQELMFRGAMDSNPEFVSKHPTLAVVKSKIVEEVQFQFSSYAGLALRLYKELPYVEIDWCVGPIPVDDAFGREVFVRYSTDLQNNGVFYTDSNGRQTIKRIKNKRYTHQLVYTDDISANIYPITSKVYIEDTDKNIRFSIFPDRGEGCTSLDEGEIDIMVHRRLAIDNNGPTDGINDTAVETGLVVRGKHRLYLSKADYKPNKFFEKKFAKELEIQPQIFTSAHPFYDSSIGYTNWSECRNEYSALNKKLPIGLHVLSFEKWNEKLLIRFENYLESTDVVKNGVKIVNILNLFKDYLIISCEETMLGTNIWRSGYFKMEWQKGKFVKKFNDVYGNDSNLEFADDVGRQYEKVNLAVGIKLVPQQIRTFVCSYRLVRETS